MENSVNSNTLGTDRIQVKAAFSTAEKFIRTVLGLAFGAACTSTVEFIGGAGGHLTRIDWHQMGLAALVGGIGGVALHYAQSPNAKVEVHYVTRPL